MNGIGLLLITAMLAGPAETSRAQGSGPAHVALLEAEYITPDAKAGGRHELVGWLDVVLTESLAQQKGLVPVDRQALDKVLAERTLSMLDVRTVDDRLKPFIASGVLICPTIVVDAKTGKAIVTVQAVLAQRGTLLAEMTATGDMAGDGWKTVPDLDRPLRQFWRDLRGQIETNLSLPGLEIRRIDLRGKSARLQWMADELTESLTVAPREGLVLLAPRQPVHTKEERLLRLMGLSSPKEGDPSTVLSAASHFQFSGELDEDFKAGLPFDQTPIKLTLRLKAGEKKLASTELAGTVGQYSQIRLQALAWANREFSKAAKVKSQPPDESHAKTLAQHELAVAKRLATISYGVGAMERDRQRRLALAALRAAHLDPTCEEAAYLIVQSIDGLYEYHGQRKTLACWDRLISEAQKYLDRFGDRIPEHHCQVLSRMITAGFRGSGLLQPSPRLGDNMVSPPDERVWRYVRAYVLAGLERGVRGESDKTYDGANALSSMPKHILMHMIPHIPDDKMDEEYRFWREFWQKRIAPLGGDKAIPWDCIEMGFAARRKDPQAVRAAAQRLAAKYPKSQKTIWRLLRDDVVSLCLHAAGDEQWLTWQPTFAKPSKPSPKIDYRTVRAFWASWRPPMPTAWDYSKAAVLPATRVTFPQDIVKLGVHRRSVPYPKLECFLLAGGDAWFVSPCLWKNWHKKRPQCLLVASLKSLRGEAVEAKVVEVPWPEPPGQGGPHDPAESDHPIVACWAVTTDSKGNETVWIGTKNRGLARFDKQQGKWIGRAYTRRQGMPSEWVSSITSFQSGNRWKLLLAGGGPRETNNRLFIWSLDVQSNEIKLLRDMAAQYHMGALTAVWADGRKVPLSACDERGYVGLDLQEVREIVCTGPKSLDFPPFDIDLRLTRTEGTSRFWQIRKGTQSDIRELSATSLDALPSPTIRGPITSSNWGEFPTPCRFSGLAWHSLAEGLPSAPLDKVCSSLVVGQHIWMVVRPYERPENAEGFSIMLYRPAPRGDKDWAEHDQWIGPFKLLDNGPIFRIASDREGGVWVTAADAVYRVDVKTLLKNARQAGMGASTESWPGEFEKRLEQAEWCVRLRMMLARKQFQQALALAEEKLAALGQVTSASSQNERNDWTRAMLHKAFVLGCVERWDDSLAVYMQVRRDETSVKTGRAQVGRHTLWVLIAARRWPEFLAEVEAQGVDFGEGTRLPNFVIQARREVDKASRQVAPRAEPTQP